ncbi:MAG TPA: hypothetical protein VE549_02825 [Myxococcaceae bacterium]|jgi:hypothetical protein|nr:hypothetical protein [Myxococcaceae bacterium]
MRQVVILMAVLCCAVPAAARADVRLGLGADYWAETRNGFLSLTIGVDGPLARYLHVGGRFGALVTGYPNTFGVPIDLFLRAHLGGGRVYLEGLVGPWLFFPTAFNMHFHGAFGFGLQTGGLVFGLEVGWVRSTHAGLRLGFQI